MERPRFPLNVLFDMAPESIVSRVGKLTVPMPTPFPAEDIGRIIHVAPTLFLPSHAPSNLLFREAYKGSYWQYIAQRRGREGLNNGRFCPTKPGKTGAINPAALI
jgi:hypothetical protein